MIKAAQNFTGQRVTRLVLARRRYPAGGLDAAVTGWVRKQ